MSALTDLITAVDALLADGAVYNAIIHGPATGDDSLVETDSGNVKTFARAIADLGLTSTDACKTALGIPTYANLAAANAALTAGAPYYDTSLSKLQIATA